MNFRSIKTLARAFPDLALYKQSRNDILFVDSRPNSTILKGVKITNSRFSTNVSVWLTPSVCFPSSEEVVFSNYKMTTEGGQQELSLNKDLFDEQRILQQFKVAIEKTLPLLNAIDDLPSLEDYLFLHKEQWLVSNFSKTQYALLSFYNQQEAEVKNVLCSIYPSLNPHHSLTKDVKQFLTLIEQDNSEKISQYFDNLSALHEAKVHKMLSK